MNFATIQALLDTQLATVVGLPTLQTENKRIDPLNGQPFARSTFVPAPSSVASVGPNGLVKLNGLYQVDLFYPQDRGTATSAAMVELVLAAFPRGLHLGTDSSLLIELSWRETGYQFKPYYAVPIRIKWSSYG